MRAGTTATIIAILTALAACGGDEFSASETDAGASGQGGSAGKAGAAGGAGASGASGAAGKAGSAGTGGAAGNSHGGAAGTSTGGAAGSSTGGNGTGGLPGSGGGSSQSFCATQGPHFLCTDFDSGILSADWSFLKNGGEIGLSTDTAVSAPNSLRVKLTPDGATPDTYAQLTRSVHNNGAGPSHVHVTTNLFISSPPSADTIWIGLIEVQLGTINTWFGWRGGQLALWTEDVSAGTSGSPYAFDAIAVGSWHWISIDMLTLASSDVGNIGVQIDSSSTYIPNIQIGNGTNIPANVLIGVREVGGGDEQNVYFDNVILDRE